MSCYDCNYYTGEPLLPCGVDPITASSSPEEGCSNWENPWGFWEWMMRIVDDDGTGSVPIDGWSLLVCDYVPPSPAVWYEPFRRRIDEDGIPYLIVTRNEFELGYARAVDLPDPDDDFEYDDESEFVDNEFDD